MSDGSVQFWSHFDGPEKAHLDWSSNTTNPSLYLIGCEFTDALGLSNQNERLMIERAVFKAEKTAASSEFEDNMMRDDAQLDAENEPGSHLLSGMNL